MKQKSVYVCQNCGAATPRWQGQCPSCGEWNTLVEEIQVGSSGGNRGNKGNGGAGKKVDTVRLSEVKEASYNKVSTGMGEVDRVLGGGLVPGQVVLLAGEPGIGKSTLLLQVANSVGGQILYVAGEESPSQIASRATRLGVDSSNIAVLSEMNVDGVIEAVRAVQAQPLQLVIIDSIQTLYTEDLNSSAGSVAQVRECASRLTTLAKRIGVPLIMVGHVNKEGEVAGPKVLEHIVDTVLSFEGDREHLYRLLRVTKNRFGPVFEVGVFEMGEKGLTEITDPSNLLIKERQPDQSGSVVTIALEGMRPLPLEIQALAVKSAFGFPRRAASGFNLNRLYLLLAVLEKHCHVKLSDKDVYVNVAAGFKASEPAIDLAVCVALASSVAEKPVDPKTVIFGEVGLSGELRQVSGLGRRAEEAKRLGFKTVIGPNNFKNVSAVLNNLGLKI